MASKYAAHCTVASIRLCPPTSNDVEGVATRVGRRPIYVRRCEWGVSRRVVAELRARIHVRPNAACPVPMAEAYPYPVFLTLLRRNSNARSNPRD